MKASGRMTKEMVLASNSTKMAGNIKAGGEMAKNMAKASSLMQLAAFMFKFGWMTR